MIIFMLNKDESVIKIEAVFNEILHSSENHLFHN